MEFGHIFIMLIVAILYLAALAGVATLFRLANSGGNLNSSMFMNAFTIVGWTWTFSVAVAGFYSVASMLEFLKFRVIVGGHGVVGMVFINFFVILLMGKGLVKSFSRIVEP